MKLMTKFLLIHWHYFVHEVIGFDKLNFLTGKNASGKSTIIDAMQLILLGDTSGNYFNKAANGRGNRTLMGYLRGELGDDEEQGFNYLRNGRFTSYLAIEFFDEAKNRYFTAGCCFDIYSENDKQHLFFSFDGKLPDNEFLDDDTPMDIASLRAYIKENYTARHSYTTSVGRDFKSHLYGRMGGIRDKFGTLLKKAVSFNPNVDIQQFISEFVCDVPQTVDVSGMQENIRNYKNLEQEVDILKAKINLLEKICSSHENYIKQCQNEMLYSYLMDRAKADVKLSELKDAQEKKSLIEEQLHNIEDRLHINNESLERLKIELDNLKADLQNDKNEQLLKQVEGQIYDTKKRMDELEREYDSSVGSFAGCVFSWKRYAESALKKIDEMHLKLIDPADALILDDFQSECNSFFDQISKISVDYNYEDVNNIGEAGLKQYSDKAEDIKKRYFELSSAMERRKRGVAEERKELENERKSLENGIYHFPQDVSDLKAAVSSKLRKLAGRDVNVHIVAEAAEIKGDKWRNVIEGYLNTQKFYIIVPKEYFRAALEVFNSIKREKAIYGTGIVDIEKLIRKNPKVDQGSLAEEVTTSDDDVRVFIDYVLGYVHKCDDIQKLRNFRTAVTADGMLYKNYVVRAMNPKLWAKPAIGQGAIKRRLNDVKKEIEKANNCILSYTAILSQISDGGSLKSLSENEITRIISAAKDMENIPNLKRVLNELNEKYNAIDKSTINELRKRRDDMEADISSLSEEIVSQSTQRGEYKKEISIYNQTFIPDLIKECESLERVITDKYENEWITNSGHIRYEKELITRGAPDKIEQAFGRELARSSNSKNNYWQELRDFRNEYIRRYKMGYDVNSEDNTIYENVINELKNNALPDYITRIEDSRTKAFEQFREDFLSRLQYNIAEAKRQINTLNNALHGRYFGEDMYRFRIIPKSEYKRYYDMIVDDMLLEGGYNLFSEQFNTKYKEEISELFAIIADENGGALADQSDYERRIRTFTDYRTYLSFDIEVTNSAGDVQRLSKTIGKKSGGETQTPFYIAVLASFAQLYRVERDGSQNTARLIIFDEAFSKMDGERIVRSIGLLREFNFQAIISAPPDKIGDIAALVDRNLCVLRDGKRTCVRSFAKSQIEEIENE